MKRILFTLLFTGVMSTTYAQNPTRIISNVLKNTSFKIAYGTILDTPDDFDYKGRQTSFALTYQPEFSLGGGQFTFNPGISYVHDSYFLDDFTIRENPTDNNKTIIVPVGDIFEEATDIKKSKLAVNSFDVPLEFRYRTSANRKGFVIGLGGYFGFIFDTHTKIKYEDGQGSNVIAKEKRNYNINRFRYGVMGRIGLNNINLFATYNLNEFFENNALDGISSNTRQLAVGISFRGI
ncbi:porin family protein [Sediminitomix flava]|uniref:Outer membrane protein with beta-barrel domain n=1 Tax=Sediminitomix flava TaxID=379075 RepID=A0A315ZJD5_SEDFL|nr:outer membrane beta-barrel protein [Sediminitomix flava]PWJ44804.1 outer membrane protein with beta-barrel domain [Sediminitomix flava]